MRSFVLLSAAAALLASGSLAQAAGITGEYIEARTCDVYTGPCFANAEMDLAGKEAVMAWKVDRGRWQGVSLDGLTVAVVVKANSTLGDDGVFDSKATRMTSVILVDENATAAQQQALVGFAKENAGEYTHEVARIERAPLSLKNDHVDGRGLFSAGKLAKIETRALKEDDCVCTNEIVYYQPLTKVENVSPVYTKTLDYKGDALHATWSRHELRSAFLATFRK